MKTTYLYLPVIIAFLICSCTYNLPPDNNSKILEDNLGTIQKPKNFKALQKVLISSDNNRSHEYGLLRNQLDSITTLIQSQYRLTQDSLLKSEFRINLQNNRMEKQIRDLQTGVFSLLAIMLILIMIMIYRVFNLNPNPGKNRTITKVNN